MTRARTGAAIVGVLRGWPVLGFNQLFALVNMERGGTSKRTLRRALDKLVARGDVVEDTAPGIAAYSLRKLS